MGGRHGTFQERVESGLGGEADRLKRLRINVLVGIRVGLVDEGFDVGIFGIGGRLGI